MLLSNSNSHMCSFNEYLFSACNVPEHLDSENTFRKYGQLSFPHAAYILVVATES